MLIGIGPVLFLGTAHHQQMRYDLIRRAHDPGPGIAIIFKAGANLNAMLETVVVTAVKAAVKL